MRETIWVNEADRFVFQDFIGITESVTRHWINHGKVIVHVLGSRPENSSRRRVH